MRISVSSSGKRGNSERWEMGFLPRPDLTGQCSLSWPRQTRDSRLERVKSPRLAARTRLLESPRLRGAYCRRFRCRHPSIAKARRHREWNTRVGRVSATLPGLLPQEFDVAEWDGGISPLANGAWRSGAVPAAGLGVRLSFAWPWQTPFQLDFRGRAASSLNSLCLSR